MTGLEKISDRRSFPCLDFGLKSLRHPQNSRFLPLNPNLDNLLHIENRQPFKVNFARTIINKNSAVPDIQRRLNEHSRRESEAGASGPSVPHPGGMGAGGQLQPGGLAREAGGGG